MHVDRRRVHPRCAGGARCPPGGRAQVRRGRSGRGPGMDRVRGRRGRHAGLVEHPPRRGCLPRYGRSRHRGGRFRRSPAAAWVAHHADPQVAGAAQRRDRRGGAGQRGAAPAHRAGGSGGRIGRPVIVAAQRCPGAAAGHRRRRAAAPALHPPADARGARAARRGRRASRAEPRRDHGALSRHAHRHLLDARDRGPRWLRRAAGADGRGAGGDRAGGAGGTQQGGHRLGHAGAAR